MTPDGIRLGDWIRSQRFHQKYGRLLVEREELLNKLDVVWGERGEKSNSPFNKSYTDTIFNLISEKDVSCHRDSLLVDLQNIYGANLKSASLGFKRGISNLVTSNKIHQVGFNIWKLGPNPDASIPVYIDPDKKSRSYKYDEAILSLFTDENSIVIEEKLRLHVR